MGQKNKEMFSNSANFYTSVRHKVHYPKHTVGRGSIKPLVWSHDPFTKFVRIRNQFDSMGWVSWHRPPMYAVPVKSNLSRPRLHESDARGYWREISRDSSNCREGCLENLSTK